MSDQAQSTVNKTNSTLAAAAAIAAGTAAYGDVIRFDNTTGFTWYYTTLDLTLSADNQTYGGVGSVTGTSIYLDYFADFYPTFSYQHSYTSGSGAEIFNSGFNNRYAKPINAGDVIGPGLAGGAFHSGSTLEFAFDACDIYYYNYQYYYDCTSGNRGLLPTDGSQAYIGVRMTIDSAFHYGWIGVENHNGYIEVFAWGYETEAGVGIEAGAVPAPGALGLLAFGAVGALSRKKRSA